MRRIAIIGSGGSGKSVLARSLGDCLGLPVIHLDPLFWRPGWVETPPHEWRARQEELVAGETWIIDGNHASTMDVRLHRADTILMLDFNRLRCTWRVVKRSLRYRRRARADRAEGCQERLDSDFLKWVWTYPRKGRPEALAAIERWAPDARVVILRSPAEVRRFQSEVGASL